MDQTCMFCLGRLGTNSVIESFAVGRRLAFDAARGRLWAICPRCGQWNLTPIEERWEAIEECERAFARTSLRTSRENIALAELREGLRLIRIGQPLQPEFAAWRYGNRLLRRRRRKVLLTGSALAIGAGALAAGVTFSSAVGLLLIASSIAPSLDLIDWIYDQVHREHVILRLDVDAGTLVIREKQLARLEFLAAETDDGWIVRFAHDKGTIDLRANLASQSAAIAVGALNRFAIRRAEVDQALTWVERLGTTENIVREAARLRDHRRRARVATRHLRLGALGLTASERLGLEMALQENAEAKAMEGELDELRRAWRAAEEIAAIADNLLISRDVLARFRKLQRSSMPYHEQSDDSSEIDNDS